MHENSIDNSNNKEKNEMKIEIYQYMRDLEAKLINQISQKDSNLRKNIEDFENKINIIMENNKNMLSEMITQKFKVGKISELEAFQKKVDSMLITHEVRIKSNMDELEKAKTRYDKIITDNLYVPGFIGTSCQYRNLAEYLSANISDMHKLKTEKEIQKREFKDIKVQIDTLNKSLYTVNDNSVKLCNRYTDSKQEEFKIIFDNLREELNQKSLEMRTNIIQIQNEFEKKFEFLNNEFQNLLNMKEELINMLGEKSNNLQNQIEELNKKFIQSDDKIVINKNNITNLEGKIKNLNKENQELAFKISNCFDSYKRIKYKLDKIKYDHKNEITESIPPLKELSNERRIRQRIGCASPPPKRPKIRIHNQIIDEKKEKNEDNILKFYSPLKPNMLLKKSKKESSNLFQLFNDSSFKEDESEGQTKQEIITLKKVDNEFDNKKNNQPNNKESKKLFDTVKSLEQEKEKEKVRDKKVRLSLKGKIKNPNEHITIDVQPEKIGVNNSDRNPTIPAINLENNTFEESQRKDVSIGQDDMFDNTDYNKKVKNFYKPNIKKLDLEIEQDKIGCKFVALSLPSHFSNKIQFNNINPKPKSRNNTKLENINNMITNYRAKRFSKVFPGGKDILELPKKINQAFGRTTYNIYLKKDAMNYINANNNINNFGYNGPKRHSIINTLRVEK